MVSAARTVRIEIPGLNAMLLQVLACGTVGLDRPSGRNVICGHTMPKLGQHSRAFDVFHWRGSARHVIKIWGALDISGAGVPSIRLTLWHTQALPFLVALKNLFIVRAKHARINAAFYCLLNFLLRGPDVPQINLIAILIFAQRLLRDVAIDASGQRISNNQRRGHQEIAPPLRANSSFPNENVRQERYIKTISFVY